MKYLSTIDLWDHTMQDAILSGQLKLQVGQWVKCGNGKLSRFVAVRGRSLWVAHDQGNAQDTKERFIDLVNASKRKGK